MFHPLRAYTSRRRRCSTPTAMRCGNTQTYLEFTLSFGTEGTVVVYSVVQFASADISLARFISGLRLGARARLG